MANDQFFSFDEALDELRLQEEELKRLVSEGEIRAFREGETMKLRRADVEALRSELSGGEVVDLGDVTEDLVFEDDPGMITEDLSDTDADTLLEDDDDVEDVGEIDLGEAEDYDDEPVAAAPVRRTRPAIAAVAGEEEEGEEVWVRALMLATTVVLVLVMPIAVSVSTGHLSDLARSVAGIFSDVPG